VSQTIHNCIAWKRVRALVIASSSVCHLCRMPLVPDAPARSRWSTEVDHVVSVKRLKQLYPTDWWSLALDPNNLRAAHQWCNRSKGAKTRAAASRPVRGQSRTWFAEQPTRRRTSRVW
jgi:5-methylcytosine-specific restriction endonuclease McrA